jgi:hypothetical protein
MQAVPFSTACVKHVYEFISEPKEFVNLIFVKLLFCELYLLSPETIRKLGNTEQYNHPLTSNIDHFLFPSVNAER